MRPSHTGGEKARIPPKPSARTVRPPQSRPQKRPWRRSKRAKATPTTEVSALWSVVLHGVKGIVAALPLIGGCQSSGSADQQASSDGTQGTMTDGQVEASATRSSATNSEGESADETNGSAPDDSPCQVLPDSPFAGGLTPRALESSIELGGEVPNFVFVSHEVRLSEATVYGVADVDVCTAAIPGVERRTELYSLSDLPDTYLVNQTYTFADTFELNEVRSLGFDVDANETRLMVGPADRTVYMVEDTLSIPAVAGYQKRGSMLHGGVPMNYAWNAAGGVALAVLTDAPGTYELPVAVSDVVSLAHRYEPRSELAQQTIFAAGDTYASDTVFVSYHDGDYFQPVKRYTQLLERLSGTSIRDQPVPDFARRPYWKTWGLDPGASGDFTEDQVRQIADELDLLGIDWIMLDWGWFTAEGNWKANDSIFPSNAELEDFVDELRGRGFHVGLWFQPLQLDSGDDEVLGSPLLQHLILDEDLDPFLDDDDLWLLDPSAEPVRQYILEQIDRFADMGVEHIYLDSQMAQLASPPNFALADPLRSHLALPQLYSEIRQRANERGLAIEICPDGRSQTILNSPQHITNIGDPKNDRQLRAEFKSLRGVLGEGAVVGTYVDPFEDNGVSGSFLNIIAIGGMLQTMFRDRADLGVMRWEEAMALYFDEDIVSGRTVDLYDIGFDYPEAHAVQTGDTHYYAFFTHTDGVDVCMSGVCDDEEDVQSVEAPRDPVFQGALELRGLDAGQAYLVRNYAGSQTNNMTADTDGTIVVADVTVDSEALFIVRPAE